MTICRAEPMPKRARMNSGFEQRDVVTAMYRSWHSAITASALLRLHIDSFFFYFCKNKSNLHSRDCEVCELLLNGSSILLIERLTV